MSENKSPSTCRSLYDKVIAVGWVDANHVDVGFVNKGNNSCVSSVVQVLLHVGAFVSWIEGDDCHRQLCTQSDECFTCTVAKVRLDIRKTKTSHLALPEKLLNISSEVDDLQQKTDSHFLLMNLLDKLDGEFLNRFPDIDFSDDWLRFSSPIFQMFGGFLKFEGECVDCGNGATLLKSFCSLELTSTSAASVQDCLSSYLSTAKCAEIGLSCSFCGGSKVPWKHHFIHTYPKYLILKLPRFNSDGSIRKKDFTLNDSVIMGNGSMSYNLCAVILATGDNITSCHYSSIVRCPLSVYHLINDTQVKMVSPLRFGTDFKDKVYVLVYEMTLKSRNVVISQCFSPVKKKADSIQREREPIDRISTPGKCTLIGSTDPLSSPPMLDPLSPLADSPELCLSVPECHTHVHQIKPQVEDQASKKDEKQRLQPRNLSKDFPKHDSEHDPQSLTAHVTQRSLRSTVFNESCCECGRIAQKTRAIVSLGVCRQEMSVKKFQFFTGVRPEHFDVLYRLLGGDEVFEKLKYEYDGLTPKKKRDAGTIHFPMQDRLFLTLVRMRRGVPLVDLAYVFGLSKSHAGRIVYAVIRHMYVTFRSLDDSLFLSVSEQRKKRNIAFKYFPNLRVILDGAHFKVQRPTNFRQQGNTYSLYKRSNTVVFVIGVTASGSIIFVSPGFEGNMSDKEIVLKSGLLDRLQPGDVVMTDKGFDLTAELQKIGVTLLKPPSLGARKHLTVQEEIFNNKLASVRIKVEHAVAQIKEFRILRGEIPITLLPILEDMVVIAAYLSNFDSP